MALYELGLVLTPELEGEEREAFLTELKTLLDAGGAKIVKEDVWGKRTLAYQIDHKREGFYLFWQFEAPGTVIKPLEYKLRLSDQVMRFLALNLDNELRRSKKFELLRAKKKASSAAAREAACENAAPAGGEA
ncbi:MAG: 30S ribosomal protein S6 [Acidobacteriota bacterium]